MIEQGASCFRLPQKSLLMEKAMCWWNRRNYTAFICWCYG